MDSVQVNFRCSPILRDKVARVSEKTGLSVSELVRESCSEIPTGELVKALAAASKRGVSENTWFAVLRAWQLYGCVNASEELVWLEGEERAQDAFEKELLAFAESLEGGQTQMNSDDVFNAVPERIKEIIKAAKAK